MYLSEYDDGLAGGWFKKILRPVAHIAAAVVTGGASIPASLAIEQARAQKKAQEAANAEAERQAKEWAAMQVPPQQPMQPQAVSHGQLVMQPGAAFPTMTAGAITSGATMTVPGAMPAWVGPAALAALAAVVLTRSGGRRAAR